MHSYQWIKPLENRGTSSAIAVNFLYRENLTYVSDNHLTAMWCWLQHEFTKHQHSIFHIDAHYDTAGHSALGSVTLPQIRELDFFGYCSTPHRRDPHSPAFRWDNYLSIYEHLNRNNIESIFMCTHGVGEEPDFPHKAVKVDMVIDAINNIESNGSWIFNLDLDFFVGNNEVRFCKNKRIDLYAAISLAVARSSFCVTTIALSPDCVGSWAGAEELLLECCDALGLQLKLPSP